MILTVIKRDGREVDFDKTKISTAIMKAMKGTEKGADEELANQIATSIDEEYDIILPIEEIQDLVEEKLMASSRSDVAKAYIRYRYKREIARQTSGTYDSILKIVELENEDIKEENSNKNAVIASTQRDYIAGEVSKDLTKRLLLPEEVRKAHDAGEIHFHDMDYFIQHIHNCALINLEDMLQNGTVINKTLIEKPHSFATACNIATQIMAIVASGQYGKNVCRIKTF